MPGERKPKERKPKSNKIPRTVYLTAETSRLLDQAAASLGVSNSIYIEFALKNQFKKDR